MENNRKIYIRLDSAVSVIQIGLKVLSEVFLDESKGLNRTKKIWEGTRNPSIFYTKKTTGKIGFDSAVKVISIGLKVMQEVLTIQGSIS